MGKMCKPELVSAVAEMTEETKKLSEKMVDAVLASIKNALGEGKKVQLVGFGNWDIVGKKARKGHNPKNHLEKIDIPAKNKIKFKEGKELLDAIADLEVKPVKEKKKKGEDE